MGGSAAAQLLHFREYRVWSNCFMLHIYAHAKSICRASLPTTRRIVVVVCRPSYYPCFCFDTSGPCRWRRRLWSGDTGTGALGWMAKPFKLAVGSTGRGRIVSIGLFVRARNILYHTVVFCSSPQVHNHFIHDGSMVWVTVFYSRRCPGRGRPLTRRTVVVPWVRSRW